MSRNIVIASAVRTAIGGFGGSLAGVSVCDLGTAVAKEAILRSGLDSSQIGQTIFGNVIHTAPQDMYLSRVVALNASVPQVAPALTINRLCGSGLQAVISGAEQIQLGYTDAVLVGGAENMSRSGHLMTQARFGQKLGDVTAIDMLIGALTDPFGHGHMGLTAENIAKDRNITREKQDAMALESHLRAASAISLGHFKGQILPISVSTGRKEFLFDTDEHVRPELKITDLNKLRPVFLKDGSVTAGNASGINDGAAALVLVEENAAKTQGLRPLARIVASGLSGVQPELMGLGPIPATQQALKRAGLKISDMDIVESNEAFAAQACAVAQELHLDNEKLNPNGGAIALGHPLGASGAIILVKLVYELQRIRGRYGLTTMCIGGGQGIALIVESC